MEKDQSFVEAPFLLPRRSAVYLIQNRAKVKRHGRRRVARGSLARISKGRNHSDLGSGQPYATESPAGSGEQKARPFLLGTTNRLNRSIIRLLVFARKALRSAQSFPERVAVH